jgi:hypothetical protein
MKVETSSLRNLKIIHRKLNKIVLSRISSLYSYIQICRGITYKYTNKVLSIMSACSMEYLLYILIMNMIWGEQPIIS